VKVSWGKWLLALFLLPTFAFGDPVISCRDVHIMAADENARLRAVPVEVKLPFLAEPERPRLAEGLTHPESKDLILLNDDPISATSVLSGTPERFESANGIFVMIPGMGGNMAGYGVAGSCRQFGSTVLGNGYFPIAIQNGIYYGVGRGFATDVSRAELEGHFSQMPNQMKWTADTLGKVVRTNQKPGGTTIVTRSNGTGLILQFVSEAARGNIEALEVLKGVRGIIAAGLNSPDPEQRKLWQAAEDREPPGTLEDVAKRTDRALYEQMTWTRLPDRVYPSVKGIPPVIAVIAAADQYISQKDQVDVMKRFHEAHPDVPLVLIYTDLPHDPMYSVKYKYQTADMRDPRTERAGNGHRFWEVVENTLLAPGNLPGPNEPIKEIYLPGYLRYQSKIEAPKPAAAE